MARLRELEGGREIELGSNHVVGRSRASDLRINDGAISGLHAELKWDGATWRVQDLASRNGTLLDGRRLEPGERAPLVQGATLSFGRSELRFRLIDEEPPRLLAKATDGTVLVAKDELLCIPAASDAELMIYRDPGGAWMLESEAETRRLEDQEHLSAGGQAWRINLPAPVEQTNEVATELELADLELEFILSRDGEHVALTMYGRGEALDIKFRSHLLLLAILARQRIADTEQPHLSGPEHGWVYRSELLKELDIEFRLLNLWIHRARQQFAKLGVRGAGRIIERRAGSQQLRLGVERLRLRYS